MFKPAFLTQFRQFHFLKPLDVFIRILKYPKEVRLRDAKEYVDKICKICTKRLTTQVENIHAVSHFNAKHLALELRPRL